MQRIVVLGLLVVLEVDLRRFLVHLIEEVVGHEQRLRLAGLEREQARRGGEQRDRAGDRDEPRDVAESGLGLAGLDGRGDRIDDQLHQVQPDDGQQALHDE